MVPNSEHPHDLFGGKPEEDGVWKPADQASPNAAFHHGELARICKNPIDCRINLKPQAIAEAGA